MHIAVRLAAIPLMFLLAGCSLFTSLPESQSVDERLAQLPTENLPLDQAVTVRWDDHMIPHIEAETDRDLAVALGAVHAHLRLAQMELLRHVSQARLAELVGPVAIDIDHSLRILNYGRAADEIIANMPEKTRVWLQAFVAGVNHYQASLAPDELPHEFTVLGIEREPWTVRDLVMISRLAGTDVNWVVWVRLLQLRDHEDWSQIWARLVENGAASFPSFEDDGERPPLDTLFGGTALTSSNALAVGAEKTATGSAMMAADPHLRITVPNLWLIAGIRSPSYHAVGLMVPGLPFIAIGRNPDIAWSGTNMRAASSDLYDVSWMDPEDFETRTETIDVRWWFDREITVRETRYGPILSDAPALGLDDPDPFALKWTGHRPSDEFTAMLEAHRATNFAEFRAAFDSFAVSAQNMLYADADGNIGQIMAARLPDRETDLSPDTLILDPRKKENLWNGFLNARDLPATYNPRDGFLASANNSPARAGVPVSYFFSADDRVRRMNQVMTERERVTLDDLAELQRDVYMPSAVELRDVILDHVSSLNVTPETEKQADLLAALRSWDGEYTADSRGALALELLLNEFVPAFYRRKFGEAARAFIGAAREKVLLIEDMQDAMPIVLASDLRKALAAAAPKFHADRRWGDLHRLGLNHPLAKMPLIGSKYRFGDHPIGGSTDTLMQTAHQLTDARHDASDGPQARFLTDLGDPDANWFVLIGGQDGWINSDAFLDQTPLWRNGNYVRVPLTEDAVREAFPRTMTLRPAGSP